MPKKIVEQVQKLSNAEIKTALNFIMWSTYCYLQSLSMILSKCTYLMQKFLTTAFETLMSVCEHIYVHQLSYRYLNLHTKLCWSMNFNKYSVFFLEQGTIIISFVLKYGINFSLLSEHNQFNFIDFSLNSACKSVFLLIFPLTA